MPLQALLMAVWRGKTKSKVQVHSDQGSQFTSYEWQEFGLALHRPLVQVPENTLKFVVGLMLSSFGVFWTGEGLGADWPGDDLALLWIFVVFLVFSLSAVRLMARPKTEVTI